MEFDAAVANIRKQNNFLFKASALLSFRAQPKTETGQEVYSSFPSNLQLSGGKKPKFGEVLLHISSEGAENSLAVSKQCGTAALGSPKRKSPTARAISREHQVIFRYIYI